MILGLVTTLMASFAQQAPERAGREIGEHGHAIVQLAASPDGSVLVSAALGELQAWDPVDGRLLWKHSLPTQMAVRGLGVGDTLVAYNLGLAAVSLVDLASGNGRGGIGGPTAMQASRCLAIDPKSRWIWIGTDTGMMTRVVPDQVSSWSNRNLENGGVHALALDAAGKTLAIGGEDGTVRFLAAQGGNVDGKKVLRGHQQAVTALALDPRGALVVSASEAGDLRTWRYANARQQDLLVESGPAIVRLAIDPKGGKLAAGNALGQVEVWDLKKGKSLATLEPSGSGAVTGLVFLGKGETLAASRAGQKVTLWDLADL